VRTPTAKYRTRHFVPDKENLPEIEGTAALPIVDFETLRAVNPDIVAWLTSDNGLLNYPIFQGEDNSYYLKHMFDKGKNKSGCPFLDFENAPDFTSENSVIYGHNMLDSSMFGSLKKYMDQGYFGEHPQMNLYTPTVNYSIEIFAVHTANSSESADMKTSPWRLSWDGDTENVDWLTQIKSDIAITADDWVLTLSTCTNGGKSRLIVSGKLTAIR
jgi:SrtB family sortase